MELIKKRILIVGSNGKLGSALALFFAGTGRFELLGAGNEENSLVENIDYVQADVTKRSSIKTLFHKFFPDIVINASGYTNVDLCESNKELSWNINVKGTENIAMSSWAIDSHLIHISSDYIFDGKEGPYSEEDIPNPVSYYGRTKLAAENTLRTSGTKFTIFRTNVLYGSYIYGRPDFAGWIIENLKMGKEIKVVTDQYNNPIFINDLVSAVNIPVERGVQGIFNIGGSVVLSRYDFAARLAEYFGLDKSLIKPVTTEELKQAALRPLKSGLICTKAEKELGFKASQLEESFRILKAGR